MSARIMRLLESGAGQARQHRSPTAGLLRKVERLQQTLPDHARVIEQTVDAMLESRFEAHVSRGIELYSAEKARQLEAEVLVERLPKSLANSFRFMSDDELLLLEVIVGGLKWIKPDICSSALAIASKRVMKQNRPQAGGETPRRVKKPVTPRNRFSRGQR